MTEVLSSMSGSPSEWPVLQRIRRVLLVVDVVESVRLMHRNEADVIARWTAFVRDVQSGVLPGTGGRLVKSLGDGLLLEFDSVHKAAGVALQLHRQMALYNQGRQAADALWLRIGGHAAPVVIDQLDVYGAGVNLAARVASVADPGETIVTQEVRDQLVPGLDADVEDLGERYFKHLDEPVRCFRLGAPGESRPRVEAPAGQAPSIAVMPLRPRPGKPDAAVWSDLLAEEIICGLSRTSLLRVISRLSTAPLAERQADLGQIAAQLGARYVLSGSYAVDRKRLVVSIELCETSTHSVLLSERFVIDAAALIAGEPEALCELLMAVSQTIVVREVQRLDSLPLPSLDAYSLLLSAVTVMHAVSSPPRFQTAYDALLHLTERYPRHGAAYAWIAKWHVMRVVQGWAPDARRESLLAQQRVRDALHRDPANALALTIDGQIQGFLFKNLEAAAQRHSEALEANPNEPLAWIYRANVCAWSGDGVGAEMAAQRALQLSPLDPLKYYYESLTAAAVLASGSYERAIEVAERSLRVNRTHTATYRCLAIAQVLAGQGDQARHTVSELLRLEPTATVAGFLSRYPGSELPHGKAYGKALLDAGVPAG